MPIISALCHACKDKHGLLARNAFHFTWSQEPTIGGRLDRAKLMSQFCSCAILVANASGEGMDMTAVMVRARDAIQVTHHLRGGDKE